MYTKGYTCIIDHSYFLNRCFESDLIAVSKASFVTEFEFKVSVSDFRADLKKWAVVHPKGYSRGKRFSEIYPDEVKHKHDMVASGDFGLKFFYFVAPKGVIPIAELPEHTGLIEMHRTTGRVIVEYTRKAPTLPKAERLTALQKDIIFDKLKHRYLKMRQGELCAAIEEFEKGENRKASTR